LRESLRHSGPYAAPASPHISSLSLHDALPICLGPHRVPGQDRRAGRIDLVPTQPPAGLSPTRNRLGQAATRRRAQRRTETGWRRSEEHTSELQSHLNLVCRLLLEKKKTDKLQS